MTVYNYAFDRNANAPENRLVDKSYSFNASDVHVLISEEGLFYSKGLVVTNKSTGIELKLDADYDLVGMDPDIVALTGYEAVAGIQLKNRTFSGTLNLTCQLVGGPQGKNSNFVKELNDTILSATENFEVDWAQVRNKPSHFPAGIHTHAISSLEGLDAIAYEFAEFQKALKDRRPMYNSVQNIVEQQERTIMLLGSFRKSLNSLIAVTGSAQLIADMQVSLENIAKRIDVSGNGLQGFSSTLGTWTLGSFTRITALVTYKSASGTHSVQVDIGGDNSNVNWSRSNEFKSNEDLFALSVAETSNIVRLELKPSETGTYSVKWLAII